MAQGEFRDLDGDGYAEAWIGDTNGDGSQDVAIVDANRDGYYETALVDTDGNGAMEQMHIDANRDGVIDTVAVDTNNDSNPDVVYTDNGGLQPWQSPSTVTFANPTLDYGPVPVDTPSSTDGLQPWESPNVVHFGTPDLIPGIPLTGEGSLPVAPNDANVWVEPEYDDPNDRPWYDPLHPDYGDDFSVPPSSRPWGDTDGNGRIDDDDYE